VTFFRVGALVVALLGAACTDARPPSAVASSEAAPATDIAAPVLCEHQVPRDLCTKCSPDLVDVFKAQGDWCDEHGLPKSHCRECDPNLTFAAPAAPADWCKEHAVPESKCPKCNPSLVAKLVAAGDYCREHGYPASLCPYCHPELVKAAGHELPRFPEPGTLVRLASAETAREAGIETVPAERRAVSQTIEVVGQLAFDRNRHAALSARSEAVVSEVKVDVGDEVAPGQPLVVLTSSVVGAEQARLAAARARVETANRAVERERRLVARGISARRAVEEAEQELAAARADASGAQAALGVAGSVIAGGDGRYAITAPFKGSVVARSVAPGKTVTVGETLIEVADVSTIWAELDVPEAHASEVRLGQRVTISVRGRPVSAGDTLEGSITRIGASVDAQTRSVPVRVQLPNPAGQLKAGTFVQGTISVGAKHDAVFVPRESIQRAQGAAFVFVQKNETVFEPVTVETGAQVDDAIEVRSADLTAGSKIVTTGAFLLKTEILKESIGAGCCDEGGSEAE